MARILAVVALGGALGAVLRAIIEQAWPHRVDQIGWATFWINVAGCFLLGVLIAGVGRWRPHALLRPFLGTGVLGGYTTFSTHVVEVRDLAAAGRPGLGLVSVLVQFAAGVLAAGLGLWLVGRAGSTPTASGRVPR